MGDGMHITAIWDRLSSDDTASSLDPGLLLHHRSTWSRCCAQSAWRCRSSQWLAPWPSPARAACMCTRKIYIGMAYIHTYIESRSIGFIFHFTSRSKRRSRSYLRSGHNSRLRSAVGSGSRDSRRAAWITLRPLVNECSSTLWLEKIYSYM